MQVLGPAPRDRECGYCMLPGGGRQAVVNLAEYPVDHVGGGQVEQGGGCPGEPECEPVGPVL